ncbi:MAG: hypothetical protein KF911_09245 [Pseudomonadales bacterium]|nr:hypothetical protein [Pseudomonadales bacterium]
MNVRSSTLLMLLCSCLAASPGAAEPAPGRAPLTIPTVSTAQLAVRDGVVLAGDLDPAALDALEGTGAVIVDLTTGGEAAAPARDRIAVLGLEYHNLPVYGAVLEHDQLRQLAALVGDRRDVPVIVHCATGNRAAMVWAALELERGEPLASVLASVDPLVNRAPIRAAIEAHARDLAGDLASEAAQVPDAAD